MMISASASSPAGRQAPRGLLRAALAMLVLLATVRFGVVPAQADLTDRIPVSEDISLGREASSKFERSVRLLGGPMLDRIQRIGARVATACGRTDMPFSFKLVDDPHINAITFPGGFIYVFRGLMDHQPDDQELAGVLGHEITHATKRHAIKKILPGAILMSRAGRLPSDVRQKILALYQVGAGLPLGRRFELEADHIGVQVANRAGYDPEGLIRVLEFFEKMEKSHPGLMERLLATHPPATERLRKLRPEVARLKGR